MRVIALHAYHRRAVAHVNELFQLVVRLGEQLPRFSKPESRPLVAAERALKRKLRYTATAAEAAELLDAYPIRADADARNAAA